jgi:uncharacterized RmlC-like cupin family protein
MMNDIEAAGIDAAREAMDREIVTVRPEVEVMTRQRLPYFIGISGATAGTSGLSMSMVVIPPGGKSDPHYHEGYETAIYLIQGNVRTAYGAQLEKMAINTTGDFLFIPPGVPHQAINMSETEPAYAIVARNDPNDSENVRPHDITP